MLKKRVLTAAVAMLTGGGALVVAPPPASAANYLTTQIGVRYTGDGTVPKSTKPAVYVTSQLRDKCVFASVAAVQVDGDYIYVQDPCADGRSALGQVQFRYQGDGYTRRCRNNLGAGTVVRCNFNWPENAVKVILGASKNYPNGTITYGLASPFTD